MVAVALAAVSVASSLMAHSAASTSTAAARKAAKMNAKLMRMETAVFRALSQSPNWNVNQSGLTEIIANAILTELG